jgi:hypothetical protein
MSDGSVCLNLSGLLMKARLSADCFRVLVLGLILGHGCSSPRCSTGNAEWAAQNHQIVVLGVRLSDRFS